MESLGCKKGERESEFADAVLNTSIDGVENDRGTFHLRLIGYSAIPIGITILMRPLVIQ